MNVADINLRTEDGLIRGHAYSITKVVEVEADEVVHSLIRIRNPWGNDAEWVGPWSDGSDELINMSEVDLFQNITRQLWRAIKVLNRIWLKVQNV